MDTHRPGVEEARAQDHDGLAGALFQLHLDGAELAVDDADHALDLFGRDGSCSRLLPQQVHHMGGELVARLDAHTHRIHEKNNYHGGSTASDRAKRMKLDSGEAAPSLVGLGLVEAVLTL